MPATHLCYVVMVTSTLIEEVMICIFLKSEIEVDH